MKVLSGFSATDFFGKVQKTTRVTQSSIPQCTVATTKDKFQLNNAALNLMGLKGGDRVMILDMNLGVSDPAELKELGERFFIAQNLYSADKKGLLAEGGDFSYTGVWGVINNGAPEVTEIKHTDLISKGLVLERKGEKTSTCISYHKYVFDVERVTMEDEEGNEIKEFLLVEKGKPQPLFQLVNLQVIDHDPQVEE